MKVFLAGCLLTAHALAAAEFKVNGHTFTLPEGLTIELVAQSPLVDRPIEADFDEQGRLYVTDSSGSNDKPDKQLIDKPHRVVRLEDTDGDGRFDKTITFADKMMFPEGCMWMDGSLYVAAPPSIWKLTDTNNDGIADKRDEWFKGQTLTGCANDLHGPYKGPDGWIYWTKGAFAKQTYGNFTTRASHIFRARPDGTGLEPVMTGGMDNPVGVAFSVDGERFFTCTFIQHPEAGRRDALVHAIYGGVYGKIHDVIDDHPQTGEVMPVMTHLGAAAPAGLMCYEGEAFRDNLFVANFNMHKITRHILQRDGATYKTTDSDFLVAADTDFHPTDVLEDADGSILVIDTGAWYKLCCPTSQLAKPDVLGAIYRISKTGAKPTPRSDKVKSFWKTAASNSSQARDGLNSADEQIRIAAAHLASLNRDAQAKPALLELLDKGSAHEKRVAVEALGRLKDESVIPALFQSATGSIDRTLEHSITYALIEIARPDPIRVNFSAAPKIALTALSQIPGALKARDLIPYLSDQDDLRKTAEWIAAKHPEWGGDFAEIFRGRSDLQSIEPLLAKLANSSAIQQLLADLATSNAPVALRAMARSGLKKTPDLWIAPVAKLVRSTHPDLQRQAVAASRAFALPKDSELHTALRELAANEKSQPALRIAALRAADVRNLNDPTIQMLLGNLNSNANFEVRADVTALLTRASLDSEQVVRVAEHLPRLAPMEQNRLFEIFDKQTNNAAALRLVQELRKKVAGDSDPAAQKARLDELSAGLKDGDIRRGQAVFNSSKAACVSCHAIGYLGGKVGPDLTSIGQVRTHIDLLESIVFPSASFVRSYEPIQVNTKDGETHTGILRGDSEESILLITGPNAEQRIPRGQIADMRPGAASLMPAGMDTQLTRQELADLVAFLKGTKWGPN